MAFFVDDIEDEWTFSYKFDLVYARMLTGSVADWPKLMRQSFEYADPPSPLPPPLPGPAIRCPPV